MPRPVADDGHDFWGDLVKNYVEFKHYTNIKINSKINYLLETSWLHLDCSIRVFNCCIRVYRCISELVPINAYSWLHAYEKCPGQSLGSLGGSAGLVHIL